VSEYSLYLSCLGYLVVLVGLLAWLRDRGKSFGNYEEVVAHVAIVSPGDRARMDSDARRANTSRSVAQMGMPVGGLITVVAHILTIVGLAGYSPLGTTVLFAIGVFAPLLGAWLVLLAMRHLTPARGRHRP